VLFRLTRQSPNLVASVQSNATIARASLVARVERGQRFQMQARFIPDLHFGFAGHFNQRFQDRITDSIRRLLVVDKVDGALSRRHRATMFPHGRSFRLTGIGFGCVGLASVSALVSPLRTRTASYHSIYELFWEINGDFKLGHYPPLHLLEILLVL